MKQKICLISFDNWHYDKYIIKLLQQKGIDAYHINLGGYKHANLISRVINVFSKIFLGINLKTKKKQEHILSELEKNGQHDIILVINPDVIELKYHQLIKQHTKKYIAYLYDSLHRCPVDHLLNAGLFDEVFSFDEQDAKAHNFIKMNNYIYFDKKPIPAEKPPYKITTISSFDKRFPIYNTIANQLEQMKAPFHFIFVSRNINFKKFKYNFKAEAGAKTNKQLLFQSKKIRLKQLLKLYSEAEIILDIVQNNQTGLSFRVFEAMGMQKKLITDNKTIVNYPFYNPNNILIIDRDNPVITPEFLATDYEPVPEAIYNQYTLDNWVSTIFNLQK
ncbi:hypothetical protein [Flavobacterium cerinum]|uniref:Lipopolysaccharide biosynthesis protein n=1 Tax=Flavobacterium cerinum TaxID=2502784 RepID=A0ABY5ISR7_9FLAO|nr:hypothetical protein [Flavobacterium cerinum]UUC45320.1 hypothetical protein NOX80_17055 [Flavobacterium cerinum]